MCSDSEKNMSAFADQNHAPSLTCLRLELQDSFFRKEIFRVAVSKNDADNSESTYSDMHFIGITGGVGAGKTAILTYLESNYSCRVMLADEIAHDLMEPGTDCYRKLQELFAEDQVFEADGQIDRKKMAQVLFSDEKKRFALNDIVHPAVKQYVIDEMNRERAAQTHEVLILEAALLIEEHYDEICDELWYIYTSEENRRERLKLNRGYSDEKIDNIFASQLPESTYREVCKAEIDNNHLPEDAFCQIDELMKARQVEKTQG